MTFNNAKNFMDQDTVICSEYIALAEDFFNNPADVDAFITSCRQPLRQSIRVNRLKITPEKLASKLKQQGWQTQPIPWCEDGFWISHPDTSLSLGNTLEHVIGLFYIQESSSMLPPQALFQQQQHSTVLDMAAAPGSKTTQLAAKMENQGTLIANELSASRIKALVSNLQRCGVANTAVTHFNGDIFGEYCFETFDAILLDAPCTGEGTVRKDPQALANWNIDAILAMQTIQISLLESALLALKPGGELVYSTCTLNPHENQKVVETVLNQYTDQVEVIPLENLFDGASRACSEQGFLHIWPHMYDCEGFFVAKLKKRDSISTSSRKNRQGKSPFQAASKKAFNLLQGYLENGFGIALEHKQVYQRDSEYWLFPTSLSELEDKIRIQRCGLKLATEHKHGFKITHEAFVALANTEAAQAKGVVINAKQLADFYMGQDIPFATKGKGECGVFYEHHPIGLAKQLPNKLKNNLPRDIIRQPGSLSVY